MTIAYTEKGLTRIKSLLCYPIVASFPYTLWAPAQYDSIKLLDSIYGVTRIRGRDQFAVNAKLPEPPSYEVRVLSTEINNSYFTIASQLQTPPGAVKIPLWAVKPEVVSGQVD